MWRSRIASILVAVLAAISGVVVLLPSSASARVIKPAFSQVYAYQDIVQAKLLKVVNYRPSVYIVRPGDTLSSIANRYVEGNWKGLYWANRHTIGGDPNIIQVGERLILMVEAGYKPPTQYVTTARVFHSSYVRSSPTVSYGVYSFSALEQLWVSAGGPAWAASSMAVIAECESGGRPWAYNPSGASGLWQILGSVVPGDVFNPWVNALNAVKKFRAGGFSPWVCQA